ncbi:MAG: hypothetical protein Q7S16_01535, partial [bacterium]|nr:hypothetical protein [bacterium]
MKESVRSLRSQGKTYAEILDELKMAIPKGTLSDWCADVPLPSWYQNKIDTLNTASFSKAQRTAWASNRIKREKFLATLEADNQYLIEKIKDKSTLKLALAFLYLGEGSKWRSHSGAMLGSS